jgi:hypothetical protein
MRNRTLLLIVLVALLALVLLGCSAGRGNVSQASPTPVKTLRPLFTSTFTPTAMPLPTDTPLPVPTVQPSVTPLPPTDTPPPPTPAPPTDTVVVPTEAPPTDTPAPPSPTAGPSDTPRPRPTNTPVLPSPTPKPQVDFRVVGQDLVPKAENVAQLYTIYVRVEDAAGNPLGGLVVWDPSQPSMQAVTGDKPGYYHAEILMGGGDYYLEVKDSRSEKTKRLTTVRSGVSDEDLIKAGYCVDANDCNLNVGPQHFSWRVVFRRTW